MGVKSLCICGTHYVKDVYWQAHFHSMRICIVDLMYFYTPWNLLEPHGKWCMYTFCTYAYASITHRVIMCFHWFYIFHCDYNNMWDLTAKLLCLHELTHTYIFVFNNGPHTSWTQQCWKRAVKSIIREHQFMYLFIFFKCQERAHFLWEVKRCPCRGDRSRPDWNAKFFLTHVIWTSGHVFFIDYGFFQ